MHQSLDDTGSLISDDELEGWVKEIYKTGNGSIHLPTVRKLAEHYWDAVQKGYGKNLVNVDLDSPDAVMLTHLLNNCYTFSAAKNRTHLQALTSLLNNNGKIREWDSFKDEASKLNLKFNKTWLKTEYDLAIAGSTMASKWVQFEKTPGQMLRYSTVGDARVRDGHKQLNGITRPVNDSFWNSNYPPNGFNCRCDVDRMPYSTPATPTDKIPPVGESVPPLFQNNLAKSHLVFPKNHPYYNNNKNIASEFTKQLDEVTTKTGWINYESQNGKGSIKKHVIALLQRNSDDVINWEIANKLANEGNEVKIMPKVDIDKKQYKWLFDGAKKGKCPDLLVNGKFVEIEGSYKYESTAYNAIKNTANKALKQANEVIIHIHYQITKDDIINAINAVIKAHAKMGKVVKIRVRDKNGIYL